LVMPCRNRKRLKTRTKCRASTKKAVAPGEGTQTPQHLNGQTSIIAGARPMRAVGRGGLGEQGGHLSNYPQQDNKNTLHLGHRQKEEVVVRKERPPGKKPVPKPKRPCQRSNTGGKLCLIEWGKRPEDPVMGERR